MKVRSPRSALLLVTAALLALAGCSAGSSTTPSASAGGSAVGSSGADPASGSTGTPSGSALSVGFVAAPASLDMSVDDGAAIPQALLYNVYEGLVRLDADGKIVPLLAEKYEVSGDNKVYTFTLHKDVKFSDGAPFTAADAVFSIERVQKDWKPAVKAGMDVVAKAEAVDDSTLKVTLSKPSQSWLYAMTTRIGAMYSKTGVSDLAAKPIGTGPFTVKSYQTNVQLVLERNASYWGTAPALATVNLKYYKDANALNNALLGGQINVISTVQAPETLSQFPATKYQTIEGTTTGEVLLSFNNSKAPLTDKAVRQAVTYAIDRKAIMDTVWAGKGQLIGTHSVPTDPWYEDLYSKYPYDPAKAKELLAGKSYTLRLRVPNLPYATAAAPIIASQLKQVGINVTVDTLEFPAAWLEQVFTNADYDMSIVAHVEPRDIANIWGNPKYYTRYDNPEVQKLFADGDAGTADEFAADYKKAAEILADDAAGDWLWVLPNLIVADTDVKGILPNQVSESFDFTQISVG